MESYLLIYNFSQFIGWGWLFSLCFFYGPIGFYDNPSIEFGLKFFQCYMVMEVLHSILKILPSPFLPTALQVFARIWVIFGVMDLARHSFGIFMVCLMWSAAEIIRYSHYITMYFKKTPKMLLWVRYTAFIVLYPIGVLSEIKVIYDAYPVISKCCPRVFSFEMPNEWNFSFDYLYALFMIVAPGYLFGFPFLYTYMLGQRKRKLSKLD